MDRRRRFFHVILGVSVLLGGLFFVDIGSWRNSDSIIGIGSLKAEYHMQTSLRNEGKNEFVIKSHYYFIEKKPSCWLDGSKINLKRFNFSKYRGIYLYHTRKAGGSTLRSYFTRFTEAMNLTLEIDEGTTCRDPSGEKADTFYVTSLREPIMRSISHFEYSERWDCRKLTSNNEFLDFVPSYENAHSFDSWINFTTPCEAKLERQWHLRSHCWKKLWTCSSDCYIRWFSGANESSFKEAYTTSLQKINSFDLILQTERFLESSYVAAIEHFFDFRGFRVSDAYCAQKSREVNKRFPLVVTDKQLHLLKKNNYWDIKFYKSVFHCPLNERKLFLNRTD